MKITLTVRYDATDKMNKSINFSELKDLNPKTLKSPKYKKNFLILSGQVNEEALLKIISEIESIKEI